MGRIAGRRLGPLEAGVQPAGGRACGERCPGQIEIGTAASHCLPHRPSLPPAVLSNKTNNSKYYEVEGLAQGASKGRALSVCPVGSSSLCPLLRHDADSWHGIELKTGVVPERGKRAGAQAAGRKQAATAGGGRAQAAGGRR